MGWAALISGNAVRSGVSITLKLAATISAKASPIRIRPRFSSRQVNNAQADNGAIRPKVLCSVAGPNTICQQPHITRTNNSSRETGGFRRACQRHSPSTATAVASCNAK